MKTLEELVVRQNKSKLMYAALRCDPMFLGSSLRESVLLRKT